MKVQDIVTQKIIEQLEKGVVPWQKPWQGAGSPKNLMTKKPYRGVNVFLLGMVGYESEWWLTFKQVKKLGGSVKAGSKSTLIVFWNVYEKEVIDSETGERELRKRWTLRYYNVFNVEQTTGLEYPKPEPREFNPIEEAEKILAGYKGRPEVVVGVDRAYYSPVEDKIGIPRKENFKSDEGYYSTRFHEDAHSTGHKSRLARKEVVEANYFGSEDYSKEELVAELTASMLSAKAGIVDKTIQNSASYIQSWLKALKNDTSLIVSASSKAQKAVDYILGKDKKEEKALVKVEEKRELVAVG